MTDLSSETDTGLRVQHGTIAVDGAQLHYETRGDGPPLLIIQGGISEAGATDQLAAELASHYTVISYDRRGLSRSTPTSAVPVTMSRHAEDAVHVLTAVSSQPARIVGASIGALIGLHLAMQHPDRVAGLIAHEPPMSAVVREHDREEALDTVAELAREDVQAAIQHMAGLQGEQPAPEDGAQPAAPVGDTKQNLRWFFDHDFPAVRAATLDASQLTTVAQPTNILPTGGAAPPQRWEYRCAHQLAQQLHRPFVTMPGGHNGLVSHPWATASELKRLVTRGEA